MKRNLKRITAFMLAFVMVLGVAPAISLKAGAENLGEMNETGNLDSIYLSDLDWESATHYYDSYGEFFGVQKDHCSEYGWYCDTPGDPSTQQERYPGMGIYMTENAEAPVIYEKGLGVAPDATIVYDITGMNVVKFESDIGLQYTKRDSYRNNGADPETTKHARCMFEIYADGIQVYKSALLTPEKGEHISVEIPEGTEELKLVNKAYGSATGNDASINWASDSNWGDAKLIFAKDTEEVCLTDLDWTSAHHYYEQLGNYPVQKDNCSETPWYTNPDDNPGLGIYLDGILKKYERGIGIMPEGTVIYDISGLNVVRFESDVGVQYHKLSWWQGKGSPATEGCSSFLVYADGVLLKQTGLLYPDGGEHISVDIPEGTQELKLENWGYQKTTFGNDNPTSGADSCWGNPTLVVKKSTDTTVYVSDLEWTEQTQFYYELERSRPNRSDYAVQKDRIGQWAYYQNRTDGLQCPDFAMYMDGTPKTYTKGLGMKPEAYVVYNIEGMNVKKLTADVGICSYHYESYQNNLAKGGDAPNENKADFVVYADGAVIYKSPLIAPDAGMHIEVDIPEGTKTLKLESRSYWYSTTNVALNINDSKNYVGNDTIWGNAMFVLGNSEGGSELPDVPELGENELWLSELASIYDFQQNKDPLKKDGKMTLRDAGGNKVVYVKGVSGNAKAFATYDIAGMGVTALKAEIGVDAVMKDLGSTVFTVQADGKTIYTSKEMNAADPAVHIEVQIPKGTERLTIFAEDETITSRATWANAILVVDPNTVVQPAPKPEVRRVVNAENPLYLIGFYVYTMENIYEDGDPGYTVVEAWEAVPDELKPYSMMIILSATNGYDTPNVEKMVGGGDLCPRVTAAQAAENVIKMCQENNIPCAFQVHGGECTYELGYSFEFLKHLAETYSCLQGFTAAEMYNYPRHNGLLSPNAYLYEAAEIAVDNGLLFIWTDTNKEFALDAEPDSTIRPGGLFQYCLESCPAMARLFRENKENIVLMYKESMARSQTDSMLLGLWLSEYCGNWGVSSDWWHWESEVLGKPYWVTTGDTEYTYSNYWRLCLSMPSNLHTMSIARVAGYGATCFLNEAGYATQAINGKCLPTYQYSIAPMMSKIVNGEIKIASREEVKEKCKAVIVDSANWYNVNIESATSKLYYSTGKYGIIPIVPPSCPVEELNGYQLIIDEKLASADALKAQLDAVYTQEYTGDAWVNHSGKSWYVMNYAENQQAEMSASFALTADKFNSAIIKLDNHAVAILTEGEKDIRVDLSNYRYDCTNIWESDEWKTGGGNIGIVKVLQVLDDLADNMEADTNPDHELRTSVIVLNMDKEPSVTFETSAYIRQRMNYSVEKTGDSEWTITVNHNGFVSFTVTREDDVIEEPETKPTQPVIPYPIQQSGSSKPSGTQIHFIDVSIDDWFYSDVAFAAEHGLMTGTSGNRFSPLLNLTRAQLVTVLYRLEDEPPVSGYCSFTDAKTGAYYYSALVWAEQYAIVNGYGSGIFGVDDAITREQLVTILYRYAKYKEINITNRASLGRYDDADEISAYASDAFSWAVAEGIIQGSGSRLNPKGLSTRAEFAAIASRFFKKYML